MLFSIYLLFLLNLSLHNTVNGDVYTSMASVENLLRLERDTVRIMNDYITKEARRLSSLKKLVASYQKKHEDALDPDNERRANPVNTYLVVRSLIEDWSQMQDLMVNSTQPDEYIRNITVNRENSGYDFPTEHDLYGAAESLHRLQDIYHLSTGDIASGYVKGAKRAAELTAKHCYDLGREAYKTKNWYHALSWMQEALNRAEREKIPSIDKLLVLEHLAFAMLKQGNRLHAVKLTADILKIAPSHPRAAKNLKYYKEQLYPSDLEYDNSTLPPVTNLRLDESPTKYKFEALCRGVVKQSHREASKLRCYLKRDHPFLKLAPIKVEEIRKTPRILLFRNIVSDAEIKAIKKMATPRLRRALVHVDKTTGGVQSSDRTAQSAWIAPYEDDLVMQVTKRTGLATGLSMDTAEYLQIANYGLAGHYDAHYDFSNVANGEDTFGEGNRIATALFYMSQPGAGGATVFPDLMLTLFPTKNDAVFWFNLKRSGEPDLHTIHAACPVLAGVKWISNRWLHERGQEFIRPCALRQEVSN